MHDPKMVEMVARALCEHAIFPKQCPCKGRPFMCAGRYPGIRATAALDALAAAGRLVPEGWVAVPREPTREMRRAFHDVNERYSDHGIGESPDSQWSAMLAAAPRPEDQA